MTLSPSWIQRSEDLVGIVTPTRMSAGAAEAASGAPWSTVLTLEPQAVTPMARARLTEKVTSFANFIEYLQWGGPGFLAEGRAMGTFSGGDVSANNEVWHS